MAKIKRNTRTHQYFPINLVWFNGGGGGGGGGGIASHVMDVICWCCRERPYLRNTPTRPSDSQVRGNAGDVCKEVKGVRPDLDLRSRAVRVDVPDHDLRSRAVRMVVLDHDLRSRVVRLNVPDCDLHSRWPVPDRDNQTKLVWLNIIGSDL